MVSHWSLSDRKCPQISRTLFSILANFDKAIIWMVSTCPLISQSSNPFIKPFWIVLSAPITIGMTVTFIFNSFLFSCRVLVLIYLFAFFYFYSVVQQDAKVHYSEGSLLSFFSFFFLLTIIILLLWDFLTSALADDFSLESERQQVSSSFQYSSQYSSRS